MGLSNSPHKPGTHSPLLTPGVTLAWGATGPGVASSSAYCGVCPWGLSNPAHHRGPCQPLMRLSAGYSLPSRVEGGLAKFSSKRHKDEVDHCPSQWKGERSEEKRHQPLV